MRGLSMAILALVLVTGCSTAVVQGRAVAEPSAEVPGLPLTGDDTVHQTKVDLTEPDWLDGLVR